MEVSVTEAKSQLTDLIHRAEAGEDIVLTIHGQPVARITAVQPPRSADRLERKRRLDAIRDAAKGKAAPGPSAARSQDFLYD